MNRKACRWFVGAAVALLIAAAFAVRFGPHIYHRFIRRDVQGLGGCVLVYEVDRQRSPAPDSLDTLADALRQRLRSAGLRHADVRPVGTDRVQIEIPRPDPRSGDDLREQVAVAKELATLVGRLEFRIAANDRDDPEAIAQARAYLDGGKRVAELDRAAREGKPPPAPAPEGARPWCARMGAAPFGPARERSPTAGWNWARRNSAPYS
jgi:hypothetical protein